FVSSRRRHTIFSRDWSSDVCSSDLCCIKAKDAHNSIPTDIAMKEIRRSQNLFEKAKQFIPGGVNSPVRAFRAVGGNPVFIKRARSEERRVGKERLSRLPGRPTYDHD